VLEVLEEDTLPGGHRDSVKIGIGGENSLSSGI
jgi:hypothetical protein